MMKQGVLVYDESSDRMDIRFGLEEYYGGLHCGTTMDVFIQNRWVPTRIELVRGRNQNGCPDGSARPNLIYGLAHENAVK